MLKEIIIPNYVRKLGIKHNDLSFPRRIVYFGADFETVNGEPYTLSICGKDLKPDILYVNRENVLDKFIAYFKKRTLSHHTNIVYFHNLQFDLSVLLIKFHRYFAGRDSLKIKYKNCMIEAVIGNITFCKIYIGEKKIFLYDSLSFVSGSLDTIAKNFKFKVQKVKKPKYLGEKKLRTKEFIEYAKTDSILQFYLADWIIRQHKKFNIRVSVSISQFSARVFRHYFLRKWDRINLPNDDIINASILSYHGGKNGYYYKYPVVIKNCCEIDINSAYPYAMTKIPNFLCGEYKKINKISDEYEGIYCVSGILKDCKYKTIFTHDFKEINGRFENIWTTSYELKEAIKKDEIIIKKVFGYVWIEKPSLYNPLKDFVNMFWDKKEKSETLEEKILYKFLLNSLYGKFIQTTRVEKDNIIELNENCLVENKEIKSNLYKAGGLFNPFIATLITGYVRAYIHNLEHIYKSVHTSTDSIKTLQKIDENKLPKGLGGLKKEVEGKCIILRNKLYLHYDKQGKLKKYALHGFTGNINDLIKVIKEKKNKYTTKRLLKVREAIRQELKPLVMTELEKELNVDLSKIVYIN